jgi:UDP-glucose 4,6-dehydratase
VIDVAKSIAKIFKMPEEKVVHVKDRAFNDRRYYICDDKLSALGWTESTPWEEGLKKTIDWYLYNGFAGYWAEGEVELALQAHPTVRPSV